MNYPFVSILPIKDEVEGELKKIVKTSSFSEEDIYGWMVEASRLTGAASYEPARAYLEFSRHVAILPDGFYLLDEITLCEINPDTSIPYPYRYVKTQVMKPADSVTRNLFNPTSVCGPVVVTNPNMAYASSPYALNTELTYTIKVPPGIVRFSLEKGVVCIDYQKMKKGDDGSILIIDEPNTQMAVKCFAKMMLLQESYILQAIPRYIYNDLKDEWESYRDLAQINIKFPSAADNKYLALKQDARFRKMRYKNQ